MAYTNTYTHTHKHTYTHTHIHIHTYTHMYSNTMGNVYCVYMRMCIYIYTKDFAKQRYNTPYACNVI